MRAIPYYLAGLLFLIYPASCDASGAATSLGAQLPFWSLLPFAGILLSIALFPLFLPHFWHRHFPKVSVFWALAFALPFLVVFRQTAVYEIAHIILLDYLPFIILLWALFTISGGIYIGGSFKGTPAVNSLILLLGTFLASIIGTTGAAMLLIRPLLRSNAWRVHKAHTVVFFIFLVGNIGGSLTPLGDPPLFLGFLRGVPFFWTLHILPEMLFACAFLFLIYFILDSYYYRLENLNNAHALQKEPFNILGTYNFLLLAAVIAAVFFSGAVKLGGVEILGIYQTVENLLKDAVLIVAALLSLFITRPEIRKGNDFSWAPIQEVACLFAGIFITIIPALAILKAGEQGALGWLIKSINSPADYFWAVGLLSSFLDNAPTYLTFFMSALGKFYPGMPESQAVAALVVEKIPYLAAITAGAVFMGANTYIGNAPNFMVKSIAEEAGVNMPSFFGYIFKYSLPILIVIFILITFIFFAS